ncbi:uncharacterized protein PITG_06271 [Phytophthora infestans T30-4]|uniref:Uncharacterized protein n=1 Tax=Phytophthora infestans (strain T30-4) TaxID=403677 RepID=D0N4H1_PHYIT|nr:uncharacterized protein PITG_06271 [Phytophthora infestans T30-4]EEY69779.1 conserved hypothetical protein [Phytophthora infestans T30-4]|eukprot:XP_002998426.1 conserved hypothetical protein [Phytophthora infestans T30-4]
MTTNGRPPRPKAHKPQVTWSPMYSPYAGSVRASPRTTKLTQPEHRGPSTTRPKRPLSASQVASTTSSRMAQTSPRPSSARPARPTSASRARYMQVETIAFPMQSSTLATCEACLSPSEMGVLQEADSTAMQVKLYALLEMWGEEHLNFRSSALFCETMFKQAKAMASRMPRPNAFVSAVAFACLTQIGADLDEEYPFLTKIIEELGTAVYSNFGDLQNLEERRSALFFQHGKPWFQEMTIQKTQCKSFQSSVDASKNEILLLKEMLQEARNANSTVVASATTEKRASQQDTFDEYSIPPVLRLSDLSVESMSEEVLRVFTEISDSDARHLLSLLLENAVERDMPKLPDMLATSVGDMKGQERRNFLRECFDYVTPSELQDILHERDELNDDKRYQILVDDLHELLQMQPKDTDQETKRNCATSVALFHSEEARIGKRVHELVELVEDVATEISFFEPRHKSLFTDPLLERLRRPQNVDCECTCGRHKLIDKEVTKEPQVAPDVPIETEQNEEVKTPKPRRKSTLKRPLSAPSGRRKNAISFNTRLDAPRKSSAFIHVFPLAEVCHLLSAILHLQFSRDAVEPVKARNGDISLMFEDRFDFLKPDAGSRTFKMLAKDYLVRKYGIKSIAVMHTMQLERSLLHYTAKDNHVRCELFSWFFGADKTRTQSKDYAFAFFQKLIKCILNLYAAKKAARSNSVTSISSPISSQPQPLAYSALITMWTEYIGDGEPSSPRTIPTPLALETCKQTFPPVLQRSSHFTLSQEQLHRHSLEEKTIELEEFLRLAMITWQLIFDGYLQEVLKTIETVQVIDFEGFASCLTANDLEFTTGERYELFDLMTQEGDESVIPSKKMVQLILEAKYLNPVSTG